MNACLTFVSLLWVLMGSYVNVDTRLDTLEGEKFFNACCTPTNASIIEELKMERTGLELEILSVIQYYAENKCGSKPLSYRHAEMLFTQNAELSAYVLSTICTSKEPNRALIEAEIRFGYPLIKYSDDFDVPLDMNEITFNEWICETLEGFHCEGEEIEVLCP